jgi:hypothetical protein
LSGTLTSAGGTINFAEATPRGGRPMTTAVGITNVRANFLAGRAGETFVFTSPATQNTAVQRYDSAFRETSPRVQETLADGTRLTYWTTPLIWHLVPQPGVAQAIGTDFAVAFSNANITGSLDYMQLDSDPNATVLVSCLGPTGSAPTCTFAGAGTFREYFGTAVVRSLTSLGLSPALFLGASALDLTEQPIITCPAPLTAAAPVFFADGRARLIAAWNSVPCAAAYDTIITAPPNMTLFQQRIVNGTAFAVGDPGGLPNGVAIEVTAVSSSGTAGTVRAPLITVGLPQPGCPAGGLPPPTNLRSTFGVASDFIGWDRVDCAAAYVVRAFYANGATRDTSTALTSIDLAFARELPPGFSEFAVASVGADGTIGPFSARKTFGF